MLLALLLAAVVAFANATSSAQLAAVYPTSGGTYIYGRERLGAWTGFAAGWLFLIGKTASATAMALTVALYIVPAETVGWPQRLTAAAIVAVIALINYLGVKRTAAATAVIVSIVLLVLTTLAVIGVLHADQTPQFFTGDFTVLGIFQAAGLFFFAFAGYARIATMGEEVSNPERTIPRAILIALGTVLVIYTALAIILLSVLGLDRLSGTPTALATLAQEVGGTPLTVAVTIVAALASSGALLALMTGIGRTTLAMARNRDMPPALAAVHPKYGVPHRAELLLAVIVIVLVLSTDLRNAIGFSSFGVLLYYLIANLSAITQPGEQRRYPKWLQVIGVLGCVGIAFLQPLPAVVTGLVILGVGFAGRALFRK